MDSVVDNLSQWTTTGTESTNITTFTGGPTSFTGPWGLGIGADGYLYVADEAAAMVDEFDPSGNYVNNFGQVQLGTDNDYGVAVNGTYAFVLDTTGAPPQIWQYTLSGTGMSKTFITPSTLTTPPMEGPYNLCFDSSQNLYVADHGNNRILKFTAGAYSASATFTSTDLVSSNARFADVAVDSSGNVFGADDQNGQVVEFSSSGSVIATFGGDILVQPQGLTLDPSGTLYVGDSGTDEIVVFQKN